MEPGRIQGARAAPQPSGRKAADEREERRSPTKTEVLKKISDLPGIGRAEELERNIREFQRSRWMEPTPDIERDALPGAPPAEASDSATSASQIASLSALQANGLAADSVLDESDLEYAQSLVERIKQELSERGPEEIARNFRFIAKNNLLALLE